MFRKSKIEPVEKVKIVERYLAGEIGIRQAGKRIGVDHHSIQNWISIYQYDGPTGLLNQPKNKSYSKDLKISAINDYLNGEGSLLGYLHKKYEFVHTDSFPIGLRCIILVEY